MTVTPATRRVLLADNSADFAAALGEVIGMEPTLDYVGHVSTGAAALESLRTLPTDVLILDLGLEDMNGLDVLNQIVGAQLPVKVIVHTGYSSQEIADHARQLGAAAFLVKDGDIDRLLAVIHSV